MTIAENIAVIRERIEKASGGRKVALVGVAKTKSSDLVRQAVAAGIDAVAENYVQEIRKKDAEGAYGNCPVHLIGHLQQNKIKYVVGRVGLIQSVDSEEVLAAIGRRAASLGTVQDVLLEVNIAGEESKTGMPAEQLDSVLAGAGELGGVRVRGLMVIPPAGNTRRYFEKTFNMYIDIISKKYDNVSMDFLSMGMSGDYEDAVKAGANMVRIGTAIFGARDYGAPSL
jgi:pyridoxal phosphate enzyme (YggS family)